MPVTEFNSLEYLRGVFKGLSPEKKDSVLNTARSLLKIQDDNNFPVNNKACSHCKKEDITSINKRSVL